MYPLLPRLTPMFPYAALDLMRKLADLPRMQEPHPIAHEPLSWRLSAQAGLLYPYLRHNTPFGVYYTFSQVDGHNCSIY